MKNNLCIRKTAAIVLVSVILILVAGCNKKEAPAAPTDLTAELSEDCIHLSWKKVPRADYYRITVGFLMRDLYNQLAVVYEVPLGEVSGTVYDDCFPFEGPNFYKIEAVNEYGSSICSEVTCDYPVSKFVHTYPNPSTDIVCVEAESISRVTITNQDNETLFDRELEYDIFTLSFDQFGPGIYIIHIFSELGETVKRVVIV